ncbi:competence protein ComK [Siminovitchia sp. 179-K 8D1 HS]|uniref:Rok-like winged helix domain-containing protein n=1 Tax=Siminovitchia sp. 179-K 8D1 HS TaxID=3142385 RepID=UPI0039A117E7
MLDERSALKLRLEQMKDVEERLIIRIQKERAYIFNRLRELDAQESTGREEAGQDLKFLEKAQPYLEAPKDDSDRKEVNGAKARRARPSRRSKTTKMRDAAVNILKEQTTPIRGVDLEKLIEERTGFQIANMTTFMNTIMKADEKILKVGRGLYTYQKDESDENYGPILLGTGEYDNSINDEH